MTARDAGGNMGMEMPPAWDAREARLRGKAAAMDAGEARAGELRAGAGAGGKARGRGQARAGAGTAAGEGAARGAGLRNGEDGLRAGAAGLRNASPAARPGGLRKSPRCHDLAALGKRPASAAAAPEAARGEASLRKPALRESQLLSRRRRPRAQPAPADLLIWFSIDGEDEDDDDDEEEEEVLEGSFDCTDAEVSIVVSSSSSSSESILGPKDIACTDLKHIHGSSAAEDKHEDEENASVDPAAGPHDLSRSNSGESCVSANPEDEESKDAERAEFPAHTIETHRKRTPPVSPILPHHRHRPAYL